MAPFRRTPNGGPTRIFFAADLHGSEVTYRKFLAAASFYDVDALVFGGDLMGKALVPIVRSNGTYRATYFGETVEFEGDQALQDFRRSVETTGFYWKVMGAEEYAEAAADPAVVHGLFEDLASARLRTWIELAEERLAGTGIRLFMTGGNDDEPGVLSVLDEMATDHVVASEGRVVDLDGEHTMVTVGVSTHTPWDTPRESSEDAIAALIDAGVAGVADVSRCVFNLHCPPKDTPLDTCLKLERMDHLEPGALPKPVRRGGKFVMIGGGSLAVRQAVERYQPLVGLHGHIHESMGRFRIGRTQCFNPGSEYGQGRLQGWIVALRGAKLTGYQHTSG